MLPPLLVLVVVAAAVIHLARRFLYATDVPKIKGLPEAPGLPLLGSLVHLGTDHARVTQRWGRRYGPVVQARLGNRRVVFVNSYETVRHFWIVHQSALISRPTFHTFHTLVSSSQGFTVGTSPWNESCKRRRKAAATALNRPSVNSYMPVLDLEATASIKELLDDVDGGCRDVDPAPYFQHFALNTSLTLCYGFRLDEGVQGERLREMAHVEREILNLRSTSNNWQDYVPLLRLWGAQNPAAAEYRTRRDVYLSSLLDGLKRRIEEGSDRPCMAGNFLRDPDADLSRDELKSLCLSMVAGGLDTVPSNIILSLAFLSTKQGQAVQAKAFEAIREVYPDGDPWLAGMAEEKVPYLVALVKETLRYWSVIPISLPRESVRHVSWEGAVVPAGTIFFMNAYAANYDEARYKMPELFLPERFLDDHESTGPAHYGFGAGSRMCAGTHLASRQLYTAFLRIITAFEILPARDPADAPIMDAIECNAMPASLTTDPKPFKVGLRPRNEPLLRKWIAAAEERTASL
ncbi:hypothetical protein XA68_12670 [Ophiocordyceps unilateralis]|uniref:Phenylacetate 2-hydroxylase n=1 Tax=Ophiocordyceps unilateralis TaxID=268505 RepID=A0A2A9PDX4_OPHUN|nr:hypothetical protein XA68_12670 [Ophiocordyceps unilateralis]